VGIQNQRANVSAPETEGMHYHPETIVKTESNFRDNLYPILVNWMK
jgi:hypothetical protein